MKEFTAEQIQAQFEKLPKEVQEAVTSVEVQQKIESIGNKYNLLIDQVGELVDEIGLVMLGLQKSSAFVSALTSRLSISTKTAQAIAQDVNQQIFSAIRAHLQKVEEEETGEAEAANKTAISALERVGGFTVEQDKTNAAGSNDAKEGDKDAILEGIENPPPARPTTPNIEPLIDHLLGNSVGTTEQKVEKKAPEAPMNLPTGQSKPKTDPYKEPIA